MRRRPAFRLRLEGAGVLLGLALCCPFPAAAAQRDRHVPEAVAEARASVLELTAANGLSGVVGSAIVVDARGIVLTADHVGSRGPALQVRVEDVVLAARSVARDPRRDLHLLYVPGIASPVVRIANRNGLSAGDDVWAVGGRGPARQGRVVAPAVSIPSLSPAAALIVTDVALESGMSGGALFDRQGRLRGMLLATRDAGGTARSAVVPADAIRGFLAETVRRRPPFPD